MSRKICQCLQLQEKGRYVIMNVGDCGVKCHESGAKWFKKPSRGEFWNAKYSEKRKKKKKQISEQKKEKKNKRNNKRKNKEKRRR
ncbi:MAG: hypothetical protein IKK51_08900 [Oscillospiraceae bacterium]|nr:hypothetical protein [Oscillospiraceae bacterium]